MIDKRERPAAKAGAHPWPRIVFWETTALCNLNCSHCRRTEVPDKPLPDELSTAEATRLIDEMAGWGGSLLILSGGEPLLRADIFDLTRYAVDRGLTVALASNGVLIDEQMAARIADSGVRRVSISLDGADPATHDTFRRQRGAFASAVRGIEALRGAGVPVQINVTVARHNVQQLNEIVALAKQLGAMALHLFLLVPVGCGVEIAEEQTITAEEYERTLVWLYRTEQAESALELRATCAPHYSRVVRQQQAADRKIEAAQGQQPSAWSIPEGHGGPRRGCLAGTSVCFVSHLGKVYGCGYMPLEAGDLRSESLSHIWQHSPLFAELRNADELKGKCGICQFKTVCAGCRARAYGVTGDHLAEEPFCIYRPADGGRA